MSKLELLNTILHELRAVRAKVDATADKVNAMDNKVNAMDERLISFQKETANNFNKIDRRLRFIESDYEQLNERVDKLEINSNH